MADRQLPVQPMSAEGYSHLIRPQAKLRLKPILKRAFSFLLVFALLQIAVVRSSLEPGNSTEQVRAFTRQIEFDFVSWTLEALMVKNDQLALSIPRYLDTSQQRQLVFAYLDLVANIDQLQAEIERIYSDPGIAEPAQESQSLRSRLAQLQQERQRLGPLSESILEQQVSAVLAEEGLTLGGQPIPPVLYRVTTLPLALIISPRDVIRQDADISLQPDLSLDQIVNLEKQVERAYNVSALVVPVGGIGLYPTMVMSTTDLPWLTEVIAHEWTHNYLTLRPLGWNYYTSPELRTINETTASLVGKEISRLVLARYYPEHLPPPSPAEAQPGAAAEPSSEAPPAFDFRAEMHKTRLTVDQLLAQGKIEDAERYMEQRRLYFWENGYHIRRLNQAYFAFHGAYADVPGGAAGSDPVGPAVRALRAQSRTLAEFLNRIAWVTSFDQLKEMVNP